MQGIRKLPGKPAVIGLMIAMVCFGMPVHAQAVNLGQDQLMMLEASQRVMKKDLRGAESIYSQVIESNPKNMQAYVQRAIVRREMKNRVGMEEDAVQVLNISNLELQTKPDNADLYYHRGTAYRILRDYAKARADIEKALSLSPDNYSWQQDLLAIGLEEKMM